MEKIKYNIRENSWLGKFAAYFMGVKSVAMVIGRTIHLYGASREHFLSDICWLRHEVCHIKQYQQYGMIGFLWKYFVEYLRNGYYRSSLEVAARAAENDPFILDDVELCKDSLKYFQ